MPTTAVLAALSDPTRRAVVELLRDGERSVNELVARVEIDQSGVSRHLRILSAAGMVHVRPDGRRRLYSLEPRPFLELEAWAARYRAVWESRLDRLSDRVAEPHGGKNRPRSRKP